MRMINKGFGSRKQVTNNLTNWFSMYKV